MQIGKKTSMQDIADRLGVSKNTVSLALRNRPGVSEAVRQRVIKAAVDLDYAGYGQLKSSDGEPRTVVVVVPEYVHSDLTFYHKIIMGLERHGTSTGVSVLIRTITRRQEQTSELPPLIDTEAVDGFITVGNIDGTYIRMLQNSGYAVVAVDNDYMDIEVDSVSSDNEGGAVRAVRHLIDMGHRRIGFCGPVRFASSFFQRWQGYKRALWLQGIPEDDALCMVDYGDGENDVDKVAPLVSFLEGLSDIPTAFFCANDSVAISLMGALESLGLQVPRDVSIVGFDNTERASHLRPPLTTINVRRHVMGERALELLLRDRREGHEQHCVVSLHTSLVVRDSVRRAMP